ncbi:MAG: RyR domain-containing protein [bacterium]
MTVVVCAKDEMAAMETAVTLPIELRQQAIPIFVRLAEESGITGVLEHAQQKLGIRAFGSIHDGCRIHDDRGRQAKSLHEVYLAEAQRAGRTADQDAAMRPWKKLDAGFKNSNQQAVDHIPVKLRAVGCVAVPVKDAPDGAVFAFTDEEVEILARMEHARWCAERFLAGWTLGPSDMPRQVSPYLVPYDQFDDKIKEYDRVAVRSIPKILWGHAGLGVKRLQP